MGGRPPVRKLRRKSRVIFIPTPFSSNVRQSLGVFRLLLQSVNGQFTEERQVPWCRDRYTPGCSLQAVVAKLKVEEEDEQVQGGVEQPVTIADNKNLIEQMKTHMAETEERLKKEK